VTVAWPGSILTTFGRPVTETRSPGQSAMRLNECPLPRARIRLAAATRRCSSPVVSGQWNRRALKVMFPAQLVRRPVIQLAAVRLVRKVEI
jgi:hypothetical protein